MTRSLREPGAALAFGVLLMAASAGAGETTLTVENAGGDLGETPAVLTLETRRAPGSYELIPASGGPTAQAEVFDFQGKTRLALFFPGVSAGKTLYTLAGPRPKSAPAVEMRPRGENLDIAVDREPFTTYAVDLGPKPILYPIFGPSGARMTRSFPMETVEGEERDHPHHRSFSFTHGKVNGIDFWTEAKGHGTIRETSRQVVEAGQVGSFLRTTDDWIGPDGVKVCEDERMLRVYAAKTARMLDFEVTLKATSGPVVLGDTKEGMFALRVASTMDAKRKGGGKIVNAEGLTNTAAWGKHSPWVDYTGPVSGKTVGIAIFDHPESHGHPTAWHVRDYGLFAANPFGLHDFGEKRSGEVTIPEGGSLAFRYRVVLHDGDTASARIADLYRAYAKPPKITVEDR